MKIGWAWEPEPHFPVDRIRPIVHYPAATVSHDEHNDGDDDGKKKHFNATKKQSFAGHKKHYLL